jgi:hypothetical protein
MVLIGLSSPEYKPDGDSVRPLVAVIEEAGKKCKIMISLKFI